MAIISVLNPKGGSGKTTISTNLARALQLRGCSVLIVDSDPQGSARDWHAADESNPLELVTLDRPNNMKSLAGIAGNYDHVVIDGAAKLEDMIAACVKACEFVLIPVQPSPYDIWAAADLVELIKTRQEVTEGTPKAGFVISRKIEGTRLGDEVRAALDEHGLPVLSASTTQRQAYAQTAAIGQTVFESSNEKAISEIYSLADELVALATPAKRKVA